jgi:hypothetical protein
MYYGQLSYLRLFFGPLSKIGYLSNNNQSPSDGTLADLESNLSLPPTITNLQLQLAVEGNQTMRNSIVNEFLTKGIQYYIPWVQAYKTSNNGISQSVSLQFDVGNGQSLMKVYHSIFNNTETRDTAYDNTNLDVSLLPVADISAIPLASGLNQKVRQFYTMLNGKRQQDITVDCQASGFFTDYLSMRRYLRGSVIQNLSQYQFNWHWCDDYSEFGASADQEGRPELIAGVPLGAMPLTWTFAGSLMNNRSGSANAYQHYSFAVFQKKLTSMPNLVKAE